MKGKLIYKYQKEGLIDILLTFIFTFLIFIICTIVLSFLELEGVSLLGYSTYKKWLGVYHFFLDINDSFGGFLFPVMVFISLYLVVTRRKAKKLSGLVKLTKDMIVQKKYASLDEDINGQIGELSKNVNGIIEILQKSIEDQKVLEKTKSDLITNVSHDLRTPLTSILGYLEFMNKDKCKDEVEMRYYIDIAYEKSKKLNMLINDLFELNRMKSTQININSEKIDLCELIGQIVAELTLQFKNNNINLRLNLPEEKVVVNADSLKLVRAFENLIINAIKYGEKNNSIEIKLEEKDSIAEISFENYGEISPLDLPHVFDRFYRVEKSRSLNLGGSGLGLAITKSIIELHNGSIEAVSDFGKTIFKVKLPKEI